ncbi:MAG: MFS transporter [Halobacteriales archaeon]
MADRGTDDGISYRALVTDPALVAVFLISGGAALGVNGIPVALPVVGETFALSEACIGLVMTAFSLPVLLVIPVLSVVADMYGRRAVALPSLVVLGIAGLATMAVSSYPVLLALRAVQGLAFAGTLPLTPTLTGDLYTGPEGSSAQGIRSGLNGLASAVAPVVAGVLAGVAWQLPFGLFGLALPIAVVVYVTYPEPIEPRGRGDGGLWPELVQYFGSVRAAVDRRLGVYLTGGFVLFVLKGGVRTFLPVYAVAGLGAPVTAAGLVMGVYGGTRLVLSPLAGSVQARLRRRRTLLLGAGLATVGMGAIPWTTTLGALFVATATYAAGESVLNPVLNDAVAGTAVAEQRAGVMSALQVLKNAALAVSPAVLGVVIGAAGYVAGFLLAAGLGLVFAGVVAVAYRPRAAG